MYSEKSIVFVDLWFIFTFLQTTGEYYRCFKHKSNKRDCDPGEIQVLIRGIKQM